MEGLEVAYLGAGGRLPGTRQKTAGFRSACVSACRPERQSFPVLSPALPQEGKIAEVEGWILGVARSLPVVVRGCHSRNPEAVNLGRDSPLKASRSDAFSHSVTACPRGRVIGDWLRDRSPVPEAVCQLGYISVAILRSRFRGANRLARSPTRALQQIRTRATPSRLAFDKALQRFRPERKLPQSERPLRPQSTGAQSLGVRWRSVFGAVDDPQVLPPPAFDGRLNQSSSAPGSKSYRLHHHALTARGSQFFPPGDALRLRRRLLQTDHAEWRCQNQGRVGLRQASHHLHLPAMILVRVHSALGRQGEKARSGLASHNRSQTAISEATAWRRPARAAAPAGACCCRNSSFALADHGISSPSRHTQFVCNSPMTRLLRRRF